MAEYTPGPWRVSGKSTINGPRGWVASVSMADRAANARLIAAAPELFEQLVWAETVLKCFIEGSAQLESLRAAIAKATDGEG